MAKLKTVTEQKIITKTYQVILCSSPGCENVNPYHSPSLVLKWKDKDWYCPEHISHEPSERYKPCVTCGHARLMHNYRKGKCNYPTCTCEKYVMPKIPRA